MAILILHLVLPAEPQRIRFHFPWQDCMFPAKSAVIGTNSLNIRFPILCRIFPGRSSFRQMILSFEAGRVSKLLVKYPRLTTPPKSLTCSILATTSNQGLLQHRDSSVRAGVNFLVHGAQLRSSEKMTAMTDRLLPSTPTKLLTGSIRKES